MNWVCLAGGDGTSRPVCPCLHYTSSSTELNDGVGHSADSPGWKPDCLISGSVIFAAILWENRAGAGLTITFFFNRELLSGF